MACKVDVFQINLSWSFAQIISVYNKDHSKAAVQFRNPVRSWLSPKSIIQISFQKQPSRIYISECALWWFSGHSRKVPQTFPAVFCPCCAKAPLLPIYISNQGRNLWFGIICRFFFKHVVYMEPVHTFSALGKKKLSSLCVLLLFFLVFIKKKHSSVWVRTDVATISRVLCVCILYCEKRIL